MKPRVHQTVGAAWALDTIRQHGLAYLSWKERTGKTLTALLTVEYSKARHALIITKKKAIDGWLETLYQWNHTTDFTVINYESAHKLNPDDYDFIILDESHHAISSVGRPSKTWKTVKRFTVGKPILYLSATPYAEHIGLIYHQLKLSDWTPLKFTNFYNFFRKYGIPNKTRTPYGLQETYTKYQTEEVLQKIEHLFNFKTRQAVGIKYEPTVNVVEVLLSPEVNKMMLEWKENRVLEIDGNTLLGDSDPKVRTVHYQLEGGTIKTDDGYIVLNKLDKIDYIKDNYDTSQIAIMAHFIAEREVLAVHFPNTPIYSSDGHAEGVAMDHIQKLLVYSMSFKTSKHTQRIARQASHSRDTPIIVDILVCSKPAIGKAVYDTVAIKSENFNKNSYERSVR